MIVQAITGLDGNSYTAQQLDACRRNGLRIQGYVWCFPHSTASSIRSRLAMFNNFIIEDLWLDLEQAGTRIIDADADLIECDAYLVKRGLGHIRTGIYTARWFFKAQGWLNLTRWSDRRLWEALYDGTPVANDHFIPYAGWTAATIEQYKGTSDIGRVHQIDLDVTA